MESAGKILLLKCLKSYVFDPDACGVWVLVDESTHILVIMVLLELVPRIMTDSTS
jgi:hypothetical protein